MGETPRYGLLLLAVSATFFFEGVAGPGDLQRVVGTALVATTLLLALYAAQVRRRRLQLIGVVAVAIFVGVVVASLASDNTAAIGLVAIANALLVALAPPAISVGLLRHIQATGTVNWRVVSGVLCIYLFVGLFFASVYVAAQNLGGAPFFADGDAATSARAVYFSFVTLTTVGYGDLTARSNLGHTLATTEALLGQIYLVTVVATIVSRIIPRGSSPA